MLPATMGVRSEGLQGRQVARCDCRELFRDAEIPSWEPSIDPGTIRHGELFLLSAAGRRTARRKRSMVRPWRHHGV